ARFRRCIAFDGLQHRAQGNSKFELLSLTFGVVRQQRQLVQPLLPPPPPSPSGRQTYALAVMNRSPSWRFRHFLRARGRGPSFSRQDSGSIGRPRMRISPPLLEPVSVG